MKTRFLLILLWFALIGSGCKSSKYTVDSPSEKRIEFGSMGGFTGLKETYIICENGQVFYSNGFAKQELKRIKKSDVKNIWNEVEVLTKSNYQIRETGNLNLYIHVFDKQLVQEWKWPTGGSVIAPVKLNPLYKLLYSYVSAPKPTE